MNTANGSHGGLASDNALPDASLRPNLRSSSTLDIPDSGAPIDNEDAFLVAPDSGDATMDGIPTTHEEDLAFLEEMDRKTAEAEELEAGQGKEYKKPMQLMEDIRKADEKAAREAGNGGVAERT
jgi:hypothetical protein